MADDARKEILETTARAIGGRGVGLWVADGPGDIHPLIESAQEPVLGPATDELKTALSGWRVQLGAGDRWVASRFDQKRWYVGRVRAAWPPSAPMDVERRGVIRRLLEFAGACIGMLDSSAKTTQDTWDEVPAGMQEIAPDGLIVRANRAQLVLAGRAPGDYLGRNIVDLLGDSELAHQALERLRAGERLRDVTARLHCGDGSVRHVLFSADAVVERGAVARSCWVMRDAAADLQTQHALEHLTAIVASADDAIIGKTLDGVVTYWNAGAERLYGYTAAEVLGKSVGLLIPPERRAELSGILAKIGRGERVHHHETTRVRKDGSRVEVSVSVSPICDERGRPIGASAIARDIMERRRAEERLRHDALHDPLTELPNRTLLAEHVAQALTRSRTDATYRFAVLYMDLDGFKLVNDSMGHGAGDRLLVEIAARLRRALRPADVVARMGGDEFTAVLDDVASPADVQQAARRIRRALAVPLTLDGRELRVTASIGAALADGTHASAADLLRDADLAMYYAKTSGHGQLQLFDVTMRETAHARFRLRTDLGTALERGELALCYQPIVDLRSGRATAFEALLRWHHGERGIVAPQEFLQVAETTGLSIPIGRWVLQEACRQAVGWQRTSTHQGVGVSVNISPRQLRDPGFAEQLRRCLADTSLDPRLLRLEITEGDLLTNGDASAKVLGQLRALNVELHVDDFGTGYSSLSYLPQFPIQAIKIDRAFVHRMGTRRTDLEIIRSIVDLAKTLGLTVIAEGVETVAQRERLLAFGCELGQGFLFSEPVEAAGVRAFLTAQAALVP